MFMCIFQTLLLTGAGLFQESFLASKMASRPSTVTIDEGKVCGACAGSPILFSAQKLEYRAQVALVMAVAR